MNPAESKQTSCDGPPAGEMLAADASRRILDVVNPLTKAESLPLEQGSGRVLAEDVLSPMNVPGHTNSAVDGFALRASDVSGDTPKSLQVSGSSLAGHPFDGSVDVGQAVLITTGAPLPAGADCVVMKEYTSRPDEDSVRIERAGKEGDNIRKAGEDIAEGGQVAAAGTRINPALQGVLASLGLDRVSVIRRPKVAVFSTGDEIQVPGETLRESSVYDSNRFILRGLLDELGVEMLDLGLVPDEPEQLTAVLSRAAADADVVITSGGVSVGEADHVKSVLEAAGHMDFWKIAIKPGRPLAFGRLGDGLFFGLPGNPVAVMVTYLQFVRPALQKLMGMTPAALPRLSAIATDKMRKKPGRKEFQRGILDEDDQGRLSVSLTGRQGSGILTSMAKANCLIVLEESRATVEPGDTVEVQLLPWTLQAGLTQSN